MFIRSNDINKSVFEYIYLIAYSIIVAMGVFGASQATYYDWWGRLYTIMIGIALLLLIVSFFFYSSVNTRTFLVGIVFLVLCFLIRQESSHGKEIMIFTAVTFFGALLDWKKTFRQYIIIASSTLIVILILYASGVFFSETINRTAEGTVRQYLGFTYTTLLANFFFHIVLAYFFIKRQSINLLETIVVLGINQIIFVATDTRAVYYEIIFFVGILWLLRCFPQIFRLKCFKIFTVLIFPTLATLIIILSALYSPLNPILDSFNKLLNTRLSLGNLAIERYGLSILGADTKWSTFTGKYGTNAYEDYFYVDSSYLNIALTYGVIILIVICIGYAIIGKKLFEKNQLAGCMSLILLAIHSFSDPQLFEPRYNPFLVLVGFAFIHRSSIIKKGFNIMNYVNIKNERDISIRSLFARVFRKWWLVIIVAAATGMLAGGYKFVSTSKAMNNNADNSMTYEEYQKKLADYEQNNKTLKASINASENALQSKIDYLSNSIIANLDPNNVYISKINLFFESPDSESSSSLRDRTANRAMDLYSTYITSFDFWSDLSTELETEPQYLAELISTSPDYEASNLLVSIKYTDENGVIKISDFMNSKALAYLNEARNQIGSFQLTTTKPVVSNIVDGSIQNWHFNKTSEIKNLENSIKQLQQTLDNLSRPVQPATASKSALIKESISFGVKGAAAGAAGMIILLSIIIVASKKVLSSREFYDRYNLKEVVKFSKSSKIHNSISLKEKFDITVENINKYSKNPSNILIVGKVPKSAINLGLAELRKRMNNCTIDYIESINDSTEHINRFKEADSIIIAETIGTSRYNIIDNNIRFINNWNMPIIGSILY